MPSHVTAIELLEVLDLVCSSNARQLYNELAGTTCLTKRSRLEVVELGLGDGAGGEQQLRLLDLC